MRRTRNLNSQSKNEWKKSHKVQGKSRGEMWKGLVAMIACTLSWVVKIWPHSKSPHKYTVWEWRQGNMLKEFNRRVTQSHLPIASKTPPTLTPLPQYAHSTSWSSKGRMGWSILTGAKKNLIITENPLNLAYFTQIRRKTAWEYGVPLGYVSPSSASIISTCGLVNSMVLFLK